MTNPSSPPLQREPAPASTREAPFDPVDATPNADEGNSLSKDTIFELLKNQRRRYVLHYLSIEPGPVRLRDLAERIAAWENDKSVSTITSDERKRVYVGLYQCHLTKMDEAGVVRFDQDRGYVERADGASLLYEYLDPNRPAEDGWSVRYLGLASASAALLLLVESGLFGIALPTAVLAGTVVAAFVALALVHAANTADPDRLEPDSLVAAARGLADTDRS